MPGLPTDKERLASLEMWVQEHSARHDREDEVRRDGKYHLISLTSAAIAAVSGIVGAVIGAVAAIAAKGG